MSCSVLCGYCHTVTLFTLEWPGSLCDSRFIEEEITGHRDPRLMNRCLGQGGGWSPGPVHSFGTDSRAGISSGGSHCLLGTSTWDSTARVRAETSEKQASGPKRLLSLSLLAGTGRIGGSVAHGGGSLPCLCQKVSRLHRPHPHHSPPPRPKALHRDHILESRALCQEPPSEEAWGLLGSLPKPHREGGSCLRSESRLGLHCVGLWLRVWPIVPVAGCPIS